MWLALLAACGTPVPGVPPELPWASPDGPGPWAVGVQTRFLERPEGDLTLEVWYPAELLPGDLPDPYEPVAFTSTAHRDALPSPRGPGFPLVVFSHGFGGLRTQSVFLTEHLASHGFVVVAPDHPNNTLLDLDPSATVAVAAARPGHLQAAADALLAARQDPSDPLFRRVLGPEYGVVGHSFGAWTALVLGGGRLDPVHAGTWCAEEDPPGCGFFAELESADLSATLPDPRVLATVALAPGAWYTFGPEGAGLQEVIDPLVLGGTLDADLPYGPEIRPTWAALPPGTPLLTLHDAAHWGFTDLCTLSSAFVDCAGPPQFMDPARVKSVTQTAVTAHLGRALTGDARYAPWASGTWASAQEDLTWEEVATPP